MSWLTGLPALARVAEVLLSHADSTFYGEYGRTVTDVNAAIGEILHSERVGLWNELIERFTLRSAFSPEYGGSRAARDFLEPFGARRLVHGHSPIPLVTGVDPSAVTSPYLYADGLCVNVDAGLFMGSPGFVFTLPDEWLVRSLATTQS